MTEVGVDMAADIASEKFSESVGWEGGSRFGSVTT